MKYVPSWFPGAGFQRQAARWKTLVDAMHARPYEIAKDAYVRSETFLFDARTEILSSTTVNLNHALLQAS